MSVFTARLAIAPMIDYTTSPFRVLMRLLAPHALLYTEMHTQGAIAHRPDRTLAFHPCETPLVLQVGGNCPTALAASAVLAEKAGFSAINLNLGCPSDKVQAGQFGACLMRAPSLVADCIAAMKEAVSIPITAKTRIGVDSDDSFTFFYDFIDTLIRAGCDGLVVHARKAWLKGLNPRQNRTVPPINYAFVYRIKTLFPDKPVTINGNINADIGAIKAHLEQVDTVMLGRLAYQNPYAIALIHKALYPSAALIPRNEAFEIYAAYAQHAACQGISASVLLKPLFNLAHGMACAKQWKMALHDIQQSKNIESLLTHPVLSSVLHPHKETVFS